MEREGLWLQPYSCLGGGWSFLPRKTGASGRCLSPDPNAALPLGLGYSHQAVLGLFRLVTGYLGGGARCWIWSETEARLLTEAMGKKYSVPGQPIACGVERPLPCNCGVCLCYLGWRLVEWFWPLFP